MMTTLEYLETQLEMLDRRLAGYKLENSIARASFSSPRKDKQPAQPKWHRFTVITEQGNTYPFTACTTDPKYHATSLYKETDCKVREVPRAGL